MEFRAFATDSALPLLSENLRPDITINNNEIDPSTAKTNVNTLDYGTLCNPCFRNI